MLHIKRFARKIISVISLTVLESYANDRMLCRVYLYFYAPYGYTSISFTVWYTRIGRRRSKLFAYVYIHRPACRYIRATCCGAIFTELSASSTKTDTYCKSLPQKGLCISESIPDLWRKNRVAAATQLFLSLWHLKYARWP